MSIIKENDRDFRNRNIEALDVRFPTSRWLAGSDAMNSDPDYSMAYVILRTGDPRLTGHGFTFTIGRGNDLCVAAIRALAPLVMGRSLADICADMGHSGASLAGDSQLRWLGPEKGVVHLALAALVNAVWDLWAKQQKKPVWRLIFELPVDDLVRLIDFRHISDALNHRKSETLYNVPDRVAPVCVNSWRRRRAIPHIRHRRVGWDIRTKKSVSFAPRPSPTVGKRSR